jgi:hypothetical protein
MPRLVTCRGEAGEIADHAAAERQDGVAALQPRMQHSFDYALQLREALGRLARRDDNLRHLDPSALSESRSGGR